MDKTQKTSFATATKKKDHFEEGYILRAMQCSTIRIKKMELVQWCQRIMANSWIQDLLRLSKGEKISIILTRLLNNNIYSTKDGSIQSCRPRLIILGKIVTKSFFHVILAFFSSVTIPSTFSRTLFICLIISFWSICCQDAYHGLLGVSIHWQFIWHRPLSSFGIVYTFIHYFNESCPFGSGSGFGLTIITASPLPWRMPFSFGLWSTLGVAWAKNWGRAPGPPPASAPSLCISLQNKVSVHRNPQSFAFHCYTTRRTNHMVNGMGMGMGMQSIILLTFTSFPGKNECCVC